MLGVWLNPRPDLIERHSVSDAVENVMERTAGAVMVEDLMRSDNREAIEAGICSDAGFLTLFNVPAMTRNDRVNPIAERVPQRSRLPPRIVSGNKQAAVASPHCDQAVRMATHLIPCDTARSFAGLEPACSNQPAKVGVSGAVLDQEDKGSPVF